MKKILILNGPNLNTIGVREPNVYGYIPINDYIDNIRSEFPDLEIHTMQSNHEGAELQVLAELPGRGEHISNIFAREEFRHKSLISPVCKGTICGFGLGSYRLALYYITI